MIIKRITVIIKTIGIAELLIGLSTLSTLAYYSAFGISKKSTGTLVFVCVTSLISLCLGAGMLASRNWARRLLVFFSFYVALKKVFIFAGILQFTGEVFTVIPIWLKDVISLVYHIAVGTFLNMHGIKKEFKIP